MLRFFLLFIKISREEKNIMKIYCYTPNIKTFFFSFVGNGWQKFLKKRLMFFLHRRCWLESLGCNDEKIHFPTVIILEHIERFFGAWKAKEMKFFFLFSVVLMESYVELQKTWNFFPLQKRERSQKKKKKLFLFTGAKSNEIFDSNENTTYWKNGIRKRQENRENHIACLVFFLQSLGKKWK